MVFQIFRYYEEKKYEIFSIKQDFNRMGINCSKFDCLTINW
jgi:hypothetical protein